eukprot:UN28162
MCHVDVCVSGIVFDNADFPSVIRVGLYHNSTLNLTAWKRSNNGKFSKWRRHVAQDLYLKRSIADARVTLVIYQFGNGAEAVGSVSFPIARSIKNRRSTTGKCSVGKKIPFRLPIEMRKGFSGTMSGHFYVVTENDYVEKCDRSRSYSPATFMLNSRSTGSFPNSFSGRSQTPSASVSDLTNDVSISTSGSSDSLSIKYDVQFEVDLPKEFHPLKSLETLYRETIRQRVKLRQLDLHKGVLMTILRIPSDTKRFQVAVQDRFPYGFETCLLDLGFYAWSVNNEGQWVIQEQRQRDGLNS